MNAAAFLLNGVLAIALLLWAGLHFAVIRIPPNYLPWAPTDLEAPPGWAARLRINGLAADAEQCLAALARSDMRFRALDPRPLTDGCGLAHGVRIERSQVPYNAAVEATCALAAALYWYERDFEILAREHFSAGLARIEHWGTYACRNIGARQEGRRSEHARANAIDIAGFILTDGTTILVRRDWGGTGTRGLFLAAAHRAACRYFNTVLGPAYNAAHGDHFHLDLGRTRLCR